MQKLGPYKIVRPLAVGGQAEILLGELQGPGGFSVRHALKVLKAPLGDRRPTEIPEARSLIAEARLLARLSHPHTLTIYGLHVYEGRLVIVLEYVPSRSLAFLMSRLRDKGERLPVEHALWIARCMLMALDRAHDLRDDNERLLGVVHRDVNPQNVLLGYDGQIKLIDFGIAISRIASRDTRFGVVKGKLDYMSPEQAYGLEDLDHRSDIYTTGLVLYELVTGVRPLGGDLDKALERARNPAIPPARKHQPDLPATIDAILARALARKPERRFQSARDMMVACSELLHTFNPRYCGDEMGPFVRAVLSQDVSGERHAARREGTQVVHEDELATPHPNASPADHRPPAGSAEPSTSARARHNARAPQAPPSAHSPRTPNRRRDATVPISLKAISKRDHDPRSAQQAPPHPDRFDPATMRFSPPQRGDAPAPPDAQSARSRYQPQRPSTPPPAATRTQPPARTPTPRSLNALDRHQRNLEPAPMDPHIREDESLDLNNLLQAIEDIYKHSNESDDAPPAEEHTRIFRRDD